MRIHASTFLPVVCLLLVATWTQGQTAAPSVPTAGTHRANIVEGYGKLPLAFEANQGQSDSQVKFLSRGGGYSLFLTPTEAVLALQASANSNSPSVNSQILPTMRRPPSIGQRSSTSAVLRMRLLGANDKAEVAGQDELPGKSNYFIGNDPKKWHTNVRQYAKVRYGNVYPGVDLVFYGNQRELEYDFVVQPGARPEAIRLGIEGADKMRLEHGDLVITSAVGDVCLRSPKVYQNVKGRRREIRGRYVIRNKEGVGFEVAAYDRRRALVIDPVLAYSTYLGGSAYDGGTGIAVDSAGNAYVSGGTSSTDFPTANAIQPTIHGSDAFITKFNADGSDIVYSTYLGGSSHEAADAIAVDSAGNAYITGWTDSTDFPTVSAFQPTFAGGIWPDAFVAKLNADGSALVYSTYLGGSAIDMGYAIAADAAGNAYVAGYTTSTDFPVANAIQPTAPGKDNAFVAKINTDGSAVYSTYLGGSDIDTASGIAADAAGNAYITGGTDSTDFPTANAVQSFLNGGSDAFVTKLNANGSAFVYSTYLGGSYADSGSGIAVDGDGNAYVAGCTFSTDFPTANAIQRAFGGGLSDAFVSKINASGTALLYSTYLGGSGRDMYFPGGGIAVDAAGSAYVTGTTLSTDFPVFNAIQVAKRGVEDAFVTKINSAGSALVYSTYLGGASHDYGMGVAADAAGSAYVVGYTYSKNFPKTALAFQQSLKGGAYSDAFVSKIASQTFLSVSLNKLSFLTQAIGTTSAAKKVTVTNDGSGVITMNRAYIAGLDPGDFAETNNCSGTLAPNASCTISVAFTPTAKNVRNSLLAISDSDPASPQGVALSGTGTFVSLSAKSLALGKVPVGITSSPKTVILTNVGNVQLNFTAIALSGANRGDFAQTNTCGTSIGAGGSCTITVTFTPTAKGARNASVSISDDGGASPQKVALTGSGT